MSFILDGCNCSGCRKARKRNEALKAGPQFHITVPPAFALPQTTTIAAPVTAKPKYKLSQQDIRAFHDNPQELFGEEIGSGAYGNVYACARSDDHVIKSFRVQDGYPVWMAFAALEYRRGSGSGMLPRIHAVSMPISDADVGYVLMEKLDKTLNKAQQGLRYDDPIVGVSRVTREVSDWISNAVEDTMLISRGMYSGDVPVQAKRMLKQAAKHLPAVIIDATAAGVPLGSDAHGGNWMFRDTGELVLTDPFVVRWVADNRSDGVKAAAQYARDTCKKANMFTPGFYSEYERRREVNVFI